MSSSMMGFSLVQSQPQWEQVRRRQLASGKLACLPREPARSRRGVAAPRGSPPHVTRIVGKVCFSCHSVSAVRCKFCEHCGAPLFRPAEPENPKPIVLDDSAS